MTFVSEILEDNMPLEVIAQPSHGLIAAVAANVAGSYRESRETNVDFITI